MVLISCSDRSKGHQRLAPGAESPRAESHGFCCSERSPLLLRLHSNSVLILGLKDTIVAFFFQSPKLQTKLIQHFIDKNMESKSDHHAVEKQDPCIVHPLLQMFFKFSFSIFKQSQIFADQQVKPSFILLVLLAAGSPAQIGEVGCIFSIYKYTPRLRSGCKS